MNSYWPDTRAQLGKTVVVAAGSVYDPSNGFLMVVGRLDYKKESRTMVDMNTSSLVIQLYTQNSTLSFIASSPEFPRLNS